MLLKHEIEHVECVQCGETFENKQSSGTMESLRVLFDEEFGLKEDHAAHKDVYHREFKCHEQGCSFKAKTEAGLRNHINQHYLESGQLWLIKRFIM